MSINPESTIDSFVITARGPLLAVFVFVVYLLLPRGFRRQFCGASPKRFARSYEKQTPQPHIQRRNLKVPVGTAPHVFTNIVHSAAEPRQEHIKEGYRYVADTQQSYSSNSNAPSPQNSAQSQQYQAHVVTPPTPKRKSFTRHEDEEEEVIFTYPEVVISSALAQLRNPGVCLRAHTSTGKSRLVRLTLTQTHAMWRKEDYYTQGDGNAEKAKVGKWYQLPLATIMYVDVGKQTPALRHVGNACISDSLCFSLQTKEGSLDLQTGTSRERDALVSCFSMVLDEIHHKYWDDVYRSPPFEDEDVHSSCAEYDLESVLIDTKSDVAISNLF